MEQSSEHKIETANSLLEYKNNIIIVRIKPDVEITVRSMQEQYDAQDKLVGNKPYAVLVDGSKNSNVSKDTREYMAKHKPKNRIATAILTNKNLATSLIANFYLKINKPLVPTKLFVNEKDALEWLKNQFSKTTS